MKPNCSSIVILYVEDDPLTLRSVTDRLRRHGVAVLAAETGEKALTLVEDHPALSAMLVDLHLPGIDGLETYARLKVSYPDLPVIVCSAHTEVPLLQRLRAMGVPEQSHLRKPCHFRDLLAAILKAAGPTKADLPPAAQHDQPE
jgi:CheY-like chemotaxis protein